MKLASIVEPVVWRRYAEGLLSRWSSAKVRRAAERYADNLPIPRGRADEISPVKQDLFLLHQSVIQRAPQIVLEFGVGFSTLVIADALLKNGRGRLYTVDTSEEWLENTRQKLPAAAPVELHHAAASIAQVNGELCHLFDDLPDVVPDLMYLDGPASGDVRGAIRGLTFAGRPPMSADLLLLESTLRPGFMLIVDGRSRNVEFLQRNLKRRYRIRRQPGLKRTEFELIE